ncbi:hypothetical protein VFPPC_17831 [Pochonia chlamydosporia 170]|uniref:Uncharacterized protein n=1 Tax=Pochonia chlamydosporia 170 TaxID=1380566 RepID=A0A219AQB3_METCM|nr:hypothetical protein VFPPC_17831 [Pochonia chlamydosporia 170]OWT42976.1 hypothetical protein VFPPC_17831 [Pochonia chlamydosporia 170]
MRSWLQQRQRHSDTEKTETPDAILTLPHPVVAGGSPEQRLVDRLYFWCFLVPDSSPPDLILLAVLDLNALGHSSLASTALTADPINTKFLVLPKSTLAPSGQEWRPVPFRPIYLTCLHLGTLSRDQGKSTLFPFSLPSPLSSVLLSSFPFLVSFFSLRSCLPQTNSGSALTVHSLFLQQLSLHELLSSFNKPGLV